MHLLYFIYGKMRKGIANILENNLTIYFYFNYATSLYRI